MGATDPSAGGTMSQRSTGRLQPVSRALNVMRAIAASDGGITLQGLSQSLDVPIASIHRILAVLTTEQFVTRSPTSRKYFLGPALLDMLSTKRTGAGMLATPHAELQRLARVTGETVFVTEMQGDRAICVALVDGRHSLRLFVQIGEEMPLHAAASARVLLSDMSDTDASSLLVKHPLTAFTSQTPQSVDAVVKQLAQIRLAGYDVCDSELDRGAWAVAAPVRQASGQVCASVTLAAPTERFSTPAERNSATQSVVEAANQISLDLGWTSSTNQDRHG